DYYCQVWNSNTDYIF
nr:immunoglobulin light chain junction region [Macaca mulatta]